MTKNTHLKKKHRENGSAPTIPDVAAAAVLSLTAVLTELKTAENGLSRNEARRRLDRFGHNEIAVEKRKAWYHRVYGNAKDPLCLLLLALGIISALTGDPKATVLIGVMLVASVTLRSIQETRADRAAEKLKAMVHTTVAAVRDGQKKEIALRCLVPGDIVHLSAGDMVPADLRLLSSRDLYLNQASLTGESLPVEKNADTLTVAPESILDAPNICFMGTNVSSGSATAVALTTGASTRFGKLAAEVAAQPEAPTSFDRGVDRYTWLMIRFVAIMVPAVFLINGFAKGDWLQAFLFALAVAVGLTPELLPMIVTVNLSKGALEMAKKKVIVKRLNAIQDFGAMDVLATDKTGTLTEGRVVLMRHVDIHGEESERLIEFAYLNSRYQTGLNNLLDEAVIKHDGINEKKLAEQYRKIDEIPFDFRRRRMSVVVEGPDGQHLLICKGAAEEMLANCRDVMIGERHERLQPQHHGHRDSLVTKMNDDGFRVIALAVRRLPPTKTVYTQEDERDMTLVGFLAFLDPPKQTAGRTIAELASRGLAVKILTGDNDLVTRRICTEVGLPVDKLLLGSDISKLTPEQLAIAAEHATVFAKLEPTHKEMVIRALQGNGHVVGFLGDGINDAPALKAADVGISVDAAVDIAKESSDIILLERSLMVLKDGVMEGRRAFGNIVKYIKMTASSNFGNMFSVVGASLFLPFLPMLPLQIITNNLLYDLSQTAIPTDEVDEDYLKRPRQWKIDGLRRFMLWLGPVSSLFDYATFFLLLYVFGCFTNPTLFHTGWFVESLFTQTLIIHVIRTDKVPFLQSRASRPLTVTTGAVLALAAWLPYSPIAPALGLTALPVAFWAWLALFIAGYFLLAQLVKNAFIRRYGWD